MSDVRLASCFLLASVLPFSAVVACGSSEGDASDAGPPVTALACPLPGALPFEVDTDWNLDYNGDLVATQTRLKHQPIDILGNPARGYAETDFEADAALIPGDEELHGIMARIESNRGLFADPIPGETVSLWEYTEDNGWASLGETTTASWSDAEPGAYSFNLDSPPPSAQEHVVRYAVLGAEPSCGAHYTYNLASQRQVVVADIDGTLTMSDDELYAEISDGSYDQVEKPGSVLLAQTWASKGYQMVYLTARPHIFRSETRAWLRAHDYPEGPVITANDLVSGDAARDYKQAWLERIIGDLEWRITAVYGNATSDIDAYAAAGISTEVTFIVGENAGIGDTVAIEGDDFTSHVTSYVESQPDAD